MKVKCLITHKQHMPNGEIREYIKNEVYVLGTFNPALFITDLSIEIV